MSGSIAERLSQRWGLPPRDAERAARVLLAKGRAAFPDLSVPDETFLEHLAGLPPPAAPESLFAEDLFLACACATGDSRAHAELERAVVPEARAALLARGADPAAAEDALQQLRQRLLLGEGRSGRIAEYAGRGPLAGWIRVAAVRTLLNLCRAEGRERGRSGALERLAAPAPPPELGYIKARYRGDFKAAFEAAFAALERRQRMALRLHLIDGLSTSKIGRIYHADPATVRRWLAEARRSLLEGTRSRLAEGLGLRPSELETLMRLLVTQLDDSVRRIFREHA